MRTRYVKLSAGLRIAAIIMSVSETGISSELEDILEYFQQWSMQIGLCIISKGKHI